MPADTAARSRLLLWSLLYMTLDLRGRFQHYYSEFIQYPSHHGAPGLLWLNTWDNTGNNSKCQTLYF